MNNYLLLFAFVVLIILLVIDKWKASLVFGGVAVFLMTFGIITPSNFLAGFANESIIIIFLLMIITSIINEHFDFINVFGNYLNKAKTTQNFLLKMGFGVGSISSFINNTPIVAIMLPYVYDWGKKRNIAPSLLLIPLSYMTVLGGMITVIGTSTNLVLNGFIIAKGLTPLSTFDFLVPGIMVTITGVLFISLIGFRLLPQNKDIISEAKFNLKEYIIEIEVVPSSKIIGKTVLEAELRNLEGIFLIEILRQSKIISPVEPNEIIFEGDKLFFAGETSKVVNLINQNKGLQLPSQHKALYENGLEIVETVIPPNSELVGKSLKEFQFRNRYDAAVIAIHRNGERVKGKIGEVILDKGDLLMLSVGKNFAEKNKQDKNFYLISMLKKVPKKSKDKNTIIMVSTLILLFLLAFGSINFFVFLILLIVLFFLFGYTNLNLIKKQISIDLLIVLGSSISISNALINSSLSTQLANLFSGFIGHGNPILAIVFIYIITVFLTSFITNAAAVAIIFPIGFALITALNLNATPVFLTIAFGASCCFLTPIGYQTNLMVYGPGNYKFNDFLKLGIPLTILYSTITLVWIIYYYL